MEHQALENVALIFPYFVTQSLTQGLTSSTIQPTPSLVPSQPLTSSLTTMMGTNLGITSCLGKNTIVGIHNMTIPLTINLPKNTSWIPTFGKPITFCDSTKTSTF